MSENLYSNYKYNGPRRRRRSIFFVVAVVILGAAFAVVLVNIAVGKPRTAEVKIELPGLEFSVLGTRGIPSKSKALELAREIRARGGAGFVDFADGEWFVIEEIGVGELKFSAEAAQVNLVHEAHRQAFESVVKSFATNCLALNALLLKNPREAAAQALEMYNELLAQIIAFDKLQGSPPHEMYSKVSLAANKQLLALFIVRGSENMTSAIKHSICAVNFAYLELLNSLRA